MSNGYAYRGAEGWVRSLVGGALFVAAASGVAAGALPGSDGVVHACFDAQRGLVRLIDPDAGGTCSRAEKAVHWNEHGVKGADGASVDVAEIIAPNDPTCPKGGVRFRAAKSDVPVCNGAPEPSRSRGDSLRRREGVVGPQARQEAVGPQVRQHPR